VRCGLACAIALLILAPAATGAPPTVSATATPAAGAAPLQVSFTASGEAVAYHWEFGDGSSAEGREVEHTYAAGRWSATLTARSAGGETASQMVAVTAYGLTLAGPNPARYGRRIVFRGAVVPAERGLDVALVGPSGRKVVGTKTRADGSYAVRTRIKHPGSYTATSERASSAPLDIRVVPRVVATLAGNRARGGLYFFNARIVPSDAGVLAVRIDRGGEVLIDRTFGARVRIKLDTKHLGTYRIRVEVVPSGLYAGIVRVLRADVVLPRLGLGSQGPAVPQLSGRLRALHYAAPSTTRFDARMLDAVYAFQKVNDLPRTGVVDARFWHALGNPRIAIPRYARPADHLEVNKGRQVLFVVRAARVALIVPISTAGVPGTYTPVGRFAIYRKVVGFDPSPLGTLYDPMYFTGGYAIHGNPSVPPYPASHGCVRVPMWVATQLYRTNSYGEAVYVY
jgi:hypothetical protein